MEKLFVEKPSKPIMKYSFSYNNERSEPLETLVSTRSGKSSDLELLDREGEKYSQRQTIDHTKKSVRNGGRAKRADLRDEILLASKADVLDNTCKAGVLDNTEAGVLENTEAEVLENTENRIDSNLFRVVTETMKETKLRE